MYVQWVIEGPKSSRAKPTNVTISGWSVDRTGSKIRKIIERQLAVREIDEETSSFQFSFAATETGSDSLAATFSRLFLWNDHWQLLADRRNKFLRHLSHKRDSKTRLLLTLLLEKELYAARYLFHRLYCRRRFVRKKYKTCQVVAHDKRMNSQRNLKLTRRLVSSVSI